MKNFLKSKKLWILLGLLLTSTLIILWIVRKKKKQQEEEETPSETETETEEENAQGLTPNLQYRNTVVKTLLENGVSLERAKLILAQALHESGNFASPVFKRTNNPFGMKHPVQRNTLSIGPDKVGYATFNSLEDAVRDYLLYAKARLMPDEFSNVQTFVSWLKSKGYFEDNLTTYMTAVTKWYNSIKQIS